MYNQTEAILSQYELEIHQVTKGRGAYICHTNQGLMTLVAFRGSKEKGEFLKEFLSCLDRAGFPIEQIYENKETQVVTQDEITGERFILKDYISGTELNTSRLEELKVAVEMLAEYHRKENKLQIQVPQVIRETSVSVVEIRRRHYRELIKVKNYIRGRKKKNEFDQIFLNAFNAMMLTAEHSVAVLEEQERMPLTYGICHGDYNQHNILKTESGWRIVNLENFLYSWSVLDLANFLRKMLEKNDWNIELGKQLIEFYDHKYPLEEMGYRQLYGLLLFPEKFWKVSNHYMNSRKSWISERDIEKIKKVVEQEEKRMNFMQNIFSFLEV